jgi:phospholipase C
MRTRSAAQKSVWLWTSIVILAVPAAGLDNFKCYKATDLKDPKFAATTVALADQFAVNDGDFEVKKPSLLCVPVDVNGSGTANPDELLTCYKSKGPKLDKSDRPRVEITNQFGTAQLEILKPANVCVASHTRETLRNACEFGPGDLPSETLGPEFPKGGDIPIEHVILVMQENRSFDHYFGRLPAAGHTDVDGIPVNASNPDALNQPVYAFHTTQYCIDDVAHSWNASHLQYNGGLNDQFVITNNPNGERAMGYMEESDLPFYYGLAKTFAIGDRFFCSVLGPTYPNRFFYLAATSDGRINNQLVAFTRDSIFDRLDDAGVSHKIYASQLAFGLLLGQQQHTLAEFFADAAAGTLPQVSYVDPAFFGEEQNDEHPPSNPQRGQQLLETIYDAVLASPNWPSTALLITYDEHGGFYDHVPPPPACIPDDVPPQLGPSSFVAEFDRLGFRVPLIAISPYSKPGYVSHEVYDLTSILRFLELMFDLPALTRRDANAIPITDLFDFTQTPLLNPPAQPAAVIDPIQDALCNAP